MTSGERAWFIAYAPLAFAYRLSVVIAIALFVASRYLVVGVAIALWPSFPDWCGRFSREFPMSSRARAFSSEGCARLASPSERAWPLRRLARDSAAAPYDGRGRALASRG